MMPTLHSHTHCQAATANATTQAWQRVCLSNRTTKTTDKPTDEEEHRTDNSGFAKKRVQWLIEHSTSHQLLWYVDSFVLRNQPLRQAQNRYAQCQKTPYTNEQTDKTQNRKPTLGKIKRGASHHTKPSLLHHI
jgi:hypothetical protein